MTRRPGGLLVPAFLLLAAAGGCAGEGSGPAAAVPPGDPAGRPAQASSVASIEKLQGTWRSRDDRAVVLEIRGDQVTSWYDGEMLGVETLRFVDGCETRREEPAGEYFLLTDGDDSLCYHLTLAGETLLEYTYLARGNTLSYRRAE